ncbi:MAG: hypothetical protein HQ559_06575 [Lentisphaerae bacterium]|nr:hypothetical protein [Lentisphaerota bacterium]
MTPVRKRRTDSWDAGLTEAQRWQAYDRFKRYTWQQVAEWAAEEFKVPEPSRSALYRWAEDMRSRESEHRIETALSQRQNVQRMMDQVGDMSPELRYAWMVKAQESSLRGDDKAGERYLKMALSLSKEQRDQVEQTLKQQAEERAQEQLTLDKREFEQKLRTGVEKGLQALFEQVEGNTKAEQLVLKLQELVKGEAA